jgi:small-conductance mechanosensitive channel
MLKKTSPLVGYLRILMALALFGSVYWQVSDRLAHNLFRPTEYFSYFTITSCLLSGFVLVTSGIGVLRNQPETKLMTLSRLTMAVSMVIVGVIYNALLANAAPDERDIGYAWPVLPNQVMHTYMPIVIFLEWLFINTTVGLKLKSAFWVLIYPLSWLGFTIIRGFSGIENPPFWPYWFIDPQYGIGTMITWILAISAFFIVLSLGLLPAQRAIAKVTK